MCCYQTHNAQLLFNKVDANTHNRHWQWVEGITGAFECVCRLTCRDVIADNFNIPTLNNICTRFTSLSNSLNLLRAHALVPPPDIRLRQNVFFVFSLRIILDRTLLSTQYTKCQLKPIPFRQNCSTKKTTADWMKFEMKLHLRSVHNDEPPPALREFSVWFVSFQFCAKCGMNTMAHLVWTVDIVRCTFQSVVLRCFWWQMDDEYIGYTLRRPKNKKFESVKSSTGKIV